VRPPRPAIKIFAFEELQQQVGGGRPLSGWQRSVYGSSAGVLWQVLTYPPDDVRARVTVDRKKFQIFI
jgi:hypothetical protein